MIGREFKFHDGAKGSALAIKIKQKKNETFLDRIKRDGTVVINVQPESPNANQELVRFLADILGIAQKRLDIIAGHEGSDKLLSILDMKPDEVQKTILDKLS